MSWIIYGNTLYFNSANNCGDTSSPATYMMLVILIVGFFSLLVYGVLIIFSICFLVSKCKGQ